MSAGICPYCKVYFKNVEVHKRYCKVAMKQETILPPELPSIQTPAEPTISKEAGTQTKFIKEELEKSRMKYFDVIVEPKSIWKRLFGKKNILKTNDIRALRSEPINLTEDQKFKQFFMNLPKWTYKKPGIIEKWRLGTDYRHCVLVSSDPKMEDTEVFIPYNKELGLLHTDKMFYDMPIKEKGTVYLSIDKFRPLVNGDDYSKEFDIPEDFAISLLNRGIDFGQLAQFKDLINEIKTDRMIKLLCIGVTALALIALFLVVYSDNKAVKLLADQVGSMAATIQSIKEQP